MICDRCKRANHIHARMIDGEHTCPHDGNHIGSSPTYIASHQRVCRDCHGIGYIDRYRCWTCNGKASQ